MSLNRGFRVPNGAWLAIMLLLAITAGWMRAVGLQLECVGALLVVACCLALEGLAGFYRSKRPDIRLATSLTLTAQIIAFSAVMACCSYAASASGGALWDENFMLWDQALGLDWRGYLSTVDAHPAVRIAFAAAYRSLVPQMLLVALILGFAGRAREGEVFVISCVIAGLLTNMIFKAMPALGIFFLLGLHPSDFRLDPVPAYIHLADAAALRDGTLQVIALHKLQGIIPFPSFHAALGVLFIRAFWAVRFARWPSIFINALMIIATPIEGGHYFVDVIAGSALAFGSYSLAERLMGRRAPHPALMRGAGLPRAAQLRLG